MEQRRARIMPVLVAAGALLSAVATAAAVSDSEDTAPRPAGTKVTGRGADVLFDVLHQHDEEPASGDDGEAAESDRPVRLQQVPARLLGLAIGDRHKASKRSLISPHTAKYEQLLKDMEAGGANKKTMKRAPMSWRQLMTAIDNYDRDRSHYSRQKQLQQRRRWPVRRRRRPLCRTYAECAAAMAAEAEVQP